MGHQFLVISIPSGQGCGSDGFRCAPATSASAALLAAVAPERLSKVGAKHFQTCTSFEKTCVKVSKSGLSGSSHELFVCLIRLSSLPLSVSFNLLIRRPILVFFFTQASCSISIFPISRRSLFFFLLCTKPLLHEFIHPPVSLHGAVSCTLYVVLNGKTGPSHIILRIEETHILTDICFTSFERRFCQKKLSE